MPPPEREVPCEPPCREPELRCEEPEPPDEREPCDLGVSVR